MYDLGYWLSKFENRRAGAQIELSLDRLEPICAKLGLKQLDCFVIKIAGTNGKGSSAVSLAGIYHNLGYNTAVYTSPHLFRFNERLKINNKELSDKTWCDAFAEIYAKDGADKLTYFEFITLAALFMISQQEIDIAILEIGMGGRLDAVNVVDADIAFVTSISMDHQNWLGDTHAKIAKEKAGIARGSKNLVCTSRVCADIITDIASANGADSYVLNKDFSYSVEDDYIFKHDDNILRFKAPNIHPDVLAGVLMCMKLINLPYDETQLLKILPKLSNLGRLTLMGNVLIDVAHNVDSASYLHKHIKNMNVKGKIYFIFSCLSGKDMKNMVKIFDDIESSWHIYEIKDNRAMDLDEIKKYLPSKAYASCKDALEEVMSLSGPDDLVVAFGSFHVAKDILLILDNNSNMKTGFEEK